MWGEMIGSLISQNGTWEWVVNITAHLISAISLYLQHILSEEMVYICNWLCSHSHFVCTLFSTLGGPSWLVSLFCGNTLVSSFKWALTLVRASPDHESHVFTTMPVNSPPNILPSSVGSRFHSHSCSAWGIVLMQCASRAPTPFFFFLNNKQQLFFGVVLKKLKFTCLTQLLS